MIKDIVFDFGGVLTTIDTTRALQRFRDLGVENPEQYINSYCQKGPFFELENGDIDAEEFCRKLSEICGCEISYNQAKDAWLGFLVEIHQEWLEYLQQLRGKYRLSILSNTNPFIQGWAQTKEFTPCGKSLADYFDMQFFSYRMNCSKPSEDIYRKMLEQGKMKADETLFVDDGQSNIDAAAKAGIKTLKAENGVDWRKALMEILAAEEQQ
ncbi:MAG: HAD family phosphatase [Bacteroidaceae bacterium]|nr:HAD family phosphatase [Bacteroidaceae bacterium]